MNNLMILVIVAILIIDFIWLSKMEMKLAKFEFRLLMVEKLHAEELVKQLDKMLLEKDVKEVLK